MQEKQKVLIVEDELLVRFVMAELLADNGFDVLQAGDAAEALLWISDNPDLAAVVSDIEMPGEMDGAQLAREVRENWPLLPVLVISGRYESPPASRRGSLFFPSQCPIVCSSRC